LDLDWDKVGPRSDQTSGNSFIGEKAAIEGGGSALLEKNTKWGGDQDRTILPEAGLGGRM